MQPFTAPDGSAVVCNGELYGFRRAKRELERKGYVFHSGSDCELLLPLWRERGVEMFRELDAEFALVLYDTASDSFVAARDPIGIRPPLLRLHGVEPHPLRQRAEEPDGPCGQNYAISPGYYYKDGEFVCYCDIAKVDAVCTMMWTRFAEISTRS